jgi:hypothetical protein
MTLEITKFWVINDVDLYIGIGLKIDIFNVSSPNFQLVQFSQEQDLLEVSNTDN